MRSRLLTAGGSSLAFWIGTALLQSAAFAQQATTAAPDAEATSGEALQEVVVTAEKRETSVQRTPIVIQAIEGDSLKGAGPADISTIGLTTPSVLFGQANGQSQVTIRGIGNDQVATGFESRTASYIDGVYIPSLNGILGSFYDIDRVEIAEGPQGDLYGRNATAGAVNIITMKPDLNKGLNGYFELTGGNYGLIETQGAIGGALSDTLAFRVAGDVVSRGGYGQDTYTHTPINNQQSRAGRVELLWKPLDRLSVLATFDYFNENDANYAAVFGGNYNAGLTPAQLAADVAPSTLTINGVPTKIYGNIPVGVLAGYSVATGKNNINEDSPPTYYDNAYGANVTATLDFTDQLLLRSISGYRFTYHDQQVPTDDTPAQINTNGVFERVNSITQELQLVGDMWHQHFVAGLYYFDDSDFSMVQVAEGYPETLGGIHVKPGTYYEYEIYGANLTTKSWAGYIHDEIDFTDQWALTLGGRYTKDILSEADITASLPSQDGLIVATPFPYPIPANAYLPERAVGYSNFSPRVTLTYKPDSVTMLYGTWAKGFKSGGWNPGSDQPPLAPTVESAFKPETITDYEVGWKQDWLDHRIRTDVSAYYYDYDNLQEQQENANYVILITNAADAKIRGLEENTQAFLTDHLLINLGMSLLDAKYSSFCNVDSNRALLPTSPSCAADGYPKGSQDLTGNYLSRAPPYVINFGADYKWTALNGTLDAHFDATGTGREYFTATNVAVVSAPPHELLNASLRYDHGKGAWTQVWIKNITNHQVPDEISVSGLSSGANLSDRLTPPLTFGVTLGYNF
jgi:iron complex outermembrane recepter protein